jgi:outer membrane lipoprotein carrier protein
MRSLACIALTWIALAMPVRAEEEPDLSDCATAAVAAVQQRYQAVRDLRARFTQETRSVALGAGGSSTHSSGAVVFAKPGKMRWTYKEPEESLVVSDGEWLWIYEPAAGEAQKLPVGDAALSGAAVQFLLGEGEILRDFRVVSEACGAAEARLVLWPRSPATYERLLILVDPRSGDLLETEVVDLLGNATRIAFREVEANLDPAPELFRFQAPPGVEVIEVAPAPVP